MAHLIYDATTRTPTARNLTPNQHEVYGVDAPFVEMYDPSLAVTSVKLVDEANKTKLGFMRALPTMVATGTAIAGGVTEAAIATGGETLIFTLSTGKWDSDVLAQLEALTETNLLNGSAAGAGSFDDEISINFTTDCVRTSDTVLTLTLPAAAGYSISGNETVTIGIPINLVAMNGVPITGTGNLSSSPATFVITNA